MGTVKETQDDYLNIKKHQYEENIESNEKQMHSKNFNENRANSDISSLLGSEDSQQKNVSTEKPTNSNSTEIEKVAEAVANLQEKDNKTVRFIDSDPEPPFINPFFTNAPRSQPIVDSNEPTEKKEHLNPSTPFFVTESRSSSESSKQPEEPKIFENPFPTMDIRSILDSDSDSD